MFLMSKFIPHILIVDDFETNIFLLQDILEEIGFTVVTAYNGKEALEIMSQENPDLVLLDILMPGLSGVEVLEIAKKDNNIKDIPVIVVSAVHESDCIYNVLNIGAEDYVKKPIRRDELLEKIEQILHKNKIEL